MMPNLRALILAPVVVPLIYCALFTALTSGGPLPVAAFLVLFVPAAVFSYAVAILFFLPTFLLLSRIARPTALLICGTGTILGALAWVPVSLLMWKSSGPDSGPPIGPWLDSFRDSLADPLTLSFPVGGLITAAVYWALARPRTRHDAARAGAATSRVWRAAALAPPIVPLAFAVVLNVLHPAGAAVPVFVMTATAAVVFSYTVTVLLFMPVLYLLSKITGLTAPLTCLAGTVLGGIAYALIRLQGPPTAGRAAPDLFAELLPPGWAGQMVWTFPMAGLITAALFWLFAYGFAWRSTELPA